MAVLVTGGAGYIGSHMVLALLDRGEDVTVLDNLSTGVWWVLPGAVNFVKGDIGDEALLDEILGAGGFDAIIHFAGSIVVPDSVADPLEYYLNYTVKSRSLMAAGKNAEARKIWEDLAKSDSPSAQEANVRLGELAGAGKN